MSDARLERLERMLAEGGLRLGRFRVAAGRSGVAIGFPGGQMLHLDWIALAGAGVLARLVRRRSRSDPRPPRRRRG